MNLYDSDGRSKMEPRNSHNKGYLSDQAFNSNSFYPPEENIEKQKNSNFGKNEFFSKKVHICFQGFTITDDQLLNLFSKYGRLRQAYICKNTPNGLNTVGYNFGFLTFFNLKDTKKLVAMRSVCIDGYNFRIKKLKYKEEYATKQKNQKKKAHFRQNKNFRENHFAFEGKKNNHKFSDFSEILDQGLYTIPEDGKLTIHTKNTEFGSCDYSQKNYRKKIILGVFGKEGTMEPKINRFSILKKGSLSMPKKKTKKAIAGEEKNPIEEKYQYRVNKIKKEVFQNNAFLKD